MLFAMAFTAYDLDPISGQGRFLFDRHLGYKGKGCQEEIEELPLRITALGGDLGSGAGTTVPYFYCAHLHAEGGFIGGERGRTVVSMVVMLNYGYVSVMTVATYLDG